VLRAKGDVIVRLNSTSFPLLEAGEEAPFEILAHLRDLRGHEPGEWPVRFAAGGELWPVRLCAIRKSRRAAALAKEKVLRRASKRQAEVRPETPELAEHIFVLVSLPIEALSVAEALDLYRARWQIELCFKRLKSLFALGHVPKRSDASARLDRGQASDGAAHRAPHRRGEASPPGDSRSQRRSPWRELQEARDSVLAALGRPLLPSHFLRAARKSPAKAPHVE